MNLKNLSLSVFILIGTVLYAYPATNYTAWAVKIADSEIAHNPELWMADFVKAPKWDYTQGLVANSIIQLYGKTKDQRYYNYVHTFADFFINAEGEIKTYKKSDYNIDRINGGNFLFEMYNYTKDEKMDLMSLGSCVLLSHRGLLQKSGTDENGWPVFVPVNGSLSANHTNEAFLKTAMIDYFKNI